MIAVLKKELRDALPWAPLGIVIAVVMVWITLPNSIGSGADFTQSIISQFGLAAALIAIGFGLLQSLPDTRNDARGYLFHRPVPANQIFRAKIAAGFIAYVLTLLPAVVMCVVYLEWRGLERLPTTGWQMVPALIHATVIFSLHPTAMWVANRDARWTGTRLLPAVAVAASIYFLSMMFAFDGSGWNPLSVMFVATVIILPPCIAFMAARHAMTQDALLPRRSASSGPFSNTVGLTLSAIVLTTTVLSFAGSYLTPDQDYVEDRVSMNRQGEFQFFRKVHDKDSWSHITRFQKGLSQDDEFQKTTEPWPEVHSTRLLGLPASLPRLLDPFPNQLTCRTDKLNFGNAHLIQHNDRILIYGNHQLVTTVTPEGSFDEHAKAIGHFSDLSFSRGISSGQRLWVSNDTNPIFVDGCDLYQFDGSELKAYPLLNDDSQKHQKRIEAMGLLFADVETPAALWTLSDDLLICHEIEPLDEHAAMPQAFDEEIDLTQQIKLPRIKIVDQKTFPIDPLGESEQLRVLRTAEGNYAFVRHDYTQNQSGYGNLVDGEFVESGQVKHPANPNAGLSERYLGWSLPPALVIGMNLWAAFYDYSAIQFAFLVSAILQAFIAAAGAYLLTRCRGLSLTQTVCWSVVGGLLGWGTWLAIIACYHQPVLDKCYHCELSARVDRETCEHCGEAWQPPENEGVEIFESTSDNMAQPTQPSMI